MLDDGTNCRAYHDPVSPCFNATSDLVRISQGFNDTGSCTGTTQSCNPGYVGRGSHSNSPLSDEEGCDFLTCGALCCNDPGATSYCGDNNVDGANGENCDDGNTVTEICAYGQTSCTVCSATCTNAPGVTSYCGDGALDFQETCDSGGSQTASCEANCSIPSCGDSITNTLTGESCDDGNSTTESCAYGQTNCNVCGSSCTNVAGATSYCGDNNVDGANGESCDDGNTSNGDGCSSICQGETPCADGSVEGGFDWWQRNDIVLCQAIDNKRVTHAQAISLCGPGWHLCTSDEFTSRNDDLSGSNQAFSGMLDDGTNCRAYHDPVSPCFNATSDLVRAGGADTGSCTGTTQSCDPGYVGRGSHSNSPSLEQGCDYLTCGALCCN
jgi:cysteine-rich repeat protein